MMMPMLTMHMLVGNLFLTGLAHADDFDLKAQRLACQRMVTIQQHGVALDLHDVEDHHLAIIATALQLPANLDARRELLFGQGAKQTLVAQAKGVFGLQL